MSDDRQELTALHMIDSSGHQGEVPTGVQFALKVGAQGSKVSVHGDALSGNPMGAGSASAAGSATPAAGTATAAAAPSGANPLVSSASVGAGQGAFTQAYAAGSANKATSALAGQAAQCPCKDASPDTTYSCDQQKAYGKCDVGWMRQASADFPNGFCAKTCGKCPSQCAT